MQPHDVSLVHQVITLSDEDVDMAMNKTEKEMVELLHTKLALRFTQSGSIPHDQAAPKPFGATVTGFRLTGGVDFSLRVVHYLSGSTGHSTDAAKIPTRTSSQGSVSGYSTKLLALQEMRHQVEMAAAKKLRDIDLQIEHELLTAAHQSNGNNSDCACSELGSECPACEVEE